MMREVRNIEVHMQPVIMELYQRFLADSAAAEVLQYGTYGEELTVNFVHKGYMSLADLRHCAAFNIAPLADYPGQETIAGLHGEVGALIDSDDEEEGG